MLALFFGKFHPLLVHLPIGIILLAILLRVMAIKERWHFLKQSLPIILGIGFLAAIATTATGLFLASSGEYGEGLIDKHRWSGLFFTALTGVTYWLIQNNYNLQIQNLAWISLAILVTLTGHWGGSLTHGEDYLSFDFAPKKAATIENIEEAILYDDVIQPILESKCYTCHSSRKQKGQLRLDQAEKILTGGENGAVIQHGVALESQLYQRLVLEELDEYHMPPKGKPQPSEWEIKLIQWWIDAGADFELKVKETPDYKRYLATLKKLERQQQQVFSSNIPDLPVEAASPEAIEALKKTGAVVLPVAQNSNYLSVNFLEKPDLAIEDINLLQALHPQLTWLKLGNTALDDEMMALINQLNSLTILHLNGTKITDQSLPLLSSLNQLQILNLSNTSVSEKGVLGLKDLPVLKRIFLFETETNFEAIVQLQSTFPKVKIDTGGYFSTMMRVDTNNTVSFSSK